MQTAVLSYVAFSRDTVLDSLIWLYTLLLLLKRHCFNFQEYIYFYFTFRGHLLSYCGVFVTRWNTLMGIIRSCGIFISNWVWLPEGKVWCLYFYRGCRNGCSLAVSLLPHALCKNCIMQIPSGVSSWIPHLFCFSRKWSTSIVSSPNHHEGLFWMPY